MARFGEENASPPADDTGVTTPTVAGRGGIWKQRLRCRATQARAANALFGALGKHLFEKLVSEMQAKLAHCAAAAQLGFQGDASVGHVEQAERTDGGAVAGAELMLWQRAIQQ